MPGTLICLWIAECCYLEDNLAAAEVWAWLAAVCFLAEKLMEYVSVYI